MRWSIFQELPESDQPLFHWGLSQRKPRRPGLIILAIRDFLLNRKFNETNISESKFSKKQNRETQETDSVLLNQGPDWHPHPHLEELSLGGEELRMYSWATTKQQRQKLGRMITTGATFYKSFSSSNSDNGKIQKSNVKRNFVC